MIVSTLDLRRHTRAIVNSLQRGEAMELTYHGHVIGRIIPTPVETTDAPPSARNDAFFGSDAENPESVSETMTRLRAPRHAH